MVQALNEIICMSSYNKASLKEALSTFECSHPENSNSCDIKRFLVEDAIDMEIMNKTRTYLLINDEKWMCGKIQIDGYFSIALKNFYFAKDTDKSIIYEIMGDENHKSCPAYLIGQIGRSTLAPKGTGKAILSEALSYISSAVNIVGGCLVYLDCTYEMKNYYLNNGFKFLQNKNKSDLIQMYKIL